MLEKVNHSQTMARYRKAPDPDKDQGGGAAGGIYLPLLGATVSAKAARQLLSHTDIRTRVGCRIGSCRNSVTGPLDDRRAHYLHSRSSEVAEMLRRPAPWRGAMEIDRLNVAIGLRERVNEHYLSDDVHKLVRARCAASSTRYNTNSSRLLRSRRRRLDERSNPGAGSASVSCCGSRLPTTDPVN